MSVERVDALIDELKKEGYSVAVIVAGKEVTDGYYRVASSDTTVQRLGEMIDGCHTVAGKLLEDLIETYNQENLGPT